MTATAIRIDELFTLAVCAGDCAKVSDMLAHGAAVNGRNAWGFSPLHWASSEGHAAVAALLLDAGADHRATAADGCTPLHLACREDCEDVIALLLRRGADASARNSAGSRPLDMLHDEDDVPAIVALLNAAGGGAAHAPTAPHGLQWRDAGVAAVSDPPLETTSAAAGSEDAPSDDGIRHHPRPSDGPPTDTGVGASTGTGGTVDAPRPRGVESESIMALVDRLQRGGAAGLESLGSPAPSRRHGGIEVSLGADGRLTDSDYAAIRREYLGRGTTGADVRRAEAASHATRPCEP